ncbi:hypothetical protein FKM82_020635 [Ascaphus truei]
MSMGSRKPNAIWIKGKKLHNLGQPFLTQEGKTDRLHVRGIEIVPRDLRRGDRNNTLPQKELFGIYTLGSKAPGSLYELKELVPFLK